MKLRSFLIAVGTGSLVLLIIGITTLSGLLSQSPLPLLRQGGVIKTPAAAMFVSQQAPAMGSLLVNVDRLEALRQLEAQLGERKRSRLELKKIKESLLANTGLDYQKDIQPWLGDEITWAVTTLDFDRNPDNGAQPGYLLAVTTKNAALAREFLQLLYSKQAIAGTSDLVLEPYKGVNLIYRQSLSPSQTETTLASAVVGDRFVLFANSPNVLRNAINNVQVPDLNLENASAYAQAIDTIKVPRIGVGVVNLPAVTAWLAKQAIAESANWDKTLTLALSVTPQGLRMETGVLGLETQSRNPLLSKPVDALNYIPASSALAAAGTDLNQLWQHTAIPLTADNSTAVNPTETLIEKFVASLENRWNLDVPKQVFRWVTGEYALSLVPNSERQERDWVFVAQKTPEGEAAIAELDSLAKERGLSIGSLPLGERTITAWTELVTASNPLPGKKRNSVRLEAQVRGVHTSVDNYEIFATSLEAMAKALAKGENGLVGNEKFEKAIAALPKENDGYLYIDWEQSQPIFEQQLPVIRFVELAGKPLLEHLRSLTLSSHGNENGVHRATVFLNLS